MKEPYAKGTTLFDLALALSEAIDLVSPLMADHHKRVAYIAASLGREMGLSDVERKELIFAGLLHDIGAFSLRQRLDLFRFEFEDPLDHARLSYQLLKDFPPLAREAEIILHHHDFWQPGMSEEIPLASHIIHLADRIAILVNTKRSVLEQMDQIMSLIMDNSGRMFMPQLIPPLLRVAGRESFWFNVVSPSLDDHLRWQVKTSDLRLGVEDLMQVAHLFSRIIDFRSPYTATHSAGVAAVSGAVAASLGFSDRNRSMIQVAGHLHDLGKLAVPVEILEKPARLSGEEYGVIKSHAFHTRRILETVPELDYAILWASQHHERLDGSGYPDHDRGIEVAFGSRVLAAADIFTAVMEDRPYRKGVARDEAMGILWKLASEEALDPEVLTAMETEADDLNLIRRQAQEDSLVDYRELIQSHPEREV